MAELIARVPPRSPLATRTLIMAHRRELVEQAASHCEAALPGRQIEVEMGSVSATGTADVTVASVQSLTSGDRLAKFDPTRFKLVLVDEAHHIVAASYMRTLAHFSLDRCVDQSPALVGVSATLSRPDGLRLGAALDRIVYHRDLIDMMDRQWLAKLVFTTVESKADVSRVSVDHDGDFRTADLSAAVNTDLVNDITVRSWRALAPGRHSTLVFCVDIAHVVGLTRKFRKHGFDARSVTSESKNAHRGETLTGFRAGEFPVLVNCGIFSEGTDIPNVDCVVLARPTRSRNLLVQMIGRGLRLHPGKADCHIIDMVSNLSRGIVTTPTLFGLDPSELVQGATADDMRSLRLLREKEATESSPARVAGDATITFTNYSCVLDLVSDMSVDQYIRQISPLAWVKVGSDKYVLSGGPSKSYLRIEKAPPDDASGAVFQVVELRALPFPLKAPFAAPRVIVRGNTIEEVVRGADTYGSNIFHHSFIRRSHAWRREPASEGQLRFLNGLRGDKSDPELTANRLTRGDATDMITKVIHGARGRFDEHLKAMRQRKRVEKSRLAKEMNETVSVGPLPS